LATPEVLHAPADPKDGFRDLFVVTSTLSNGVSAEQLNPQAISFVEDYIDRYGKSMESLRTTGKPYFDMMDEILVSHGLPKELKYLAVIESNLKTNARSWAGAVGPWQFMPATGRNMGLRINKKVDERRNFVKSTHAASKYLNGLFELYGDWLLVIAAYNGGPGKVNAAIKKSGSQDFWELQEYLPAESRNHVKKFIATHYIMEGEGGITTLTKEEASQIAFNTPANAALFADAKAQTITGRYNSTVIVKHLSMDAAAFKKINPDFDKLIAVNGRYELHLPNDKMELFLSKKFTILNECMELLLNPDSGAQASALPK
ncbi:MAG: lytic transglycosylase domain-containing protein, partial [Chitinophagaceae bacterium]|nr:lytic transglycosylase domain-containing protein [Chitinophagaceae bacterium]